MDILREAGKRHESDVDFHLHRGLANEKNVYLFKDLKFVLGGEVAQIDHLILHKYGFILIESKSVYGEVAVNSNQEWSRSFKGKWYGIPSPIAQAEAQAEILKRVLQNNAEDLLGTLLGIRKGFGGRNYDFLVAISSSAIIHRDSMPKSVGEATLKSEFVASKVKELIAGYGRWLGTSNPAFTPAELSALAAFIGDREQGAERKAYSGDTLAPKTKTVVQPARKTIAGAAPNSGLNKTKEAAWVVVCKHCDNAEGLDGRSGRHGYYVSCPDCSKNTPMKSACPKCGGKGTRVRKAKNAFTLVCDSCGDVGRFLSGN